MLGLFRTKKSKDENAKAEINANSAVMVLRLLSLAEKYILPVASKMDVREGAEGCPADSIDVFMKDVLPVLDKKHIDPSEVESVINQFHSKYEEKQILKIWLQVIKRCFLNFDLSWLQDTRVKPCWDDFLFANQRRIKMQLEASDGNWSDATRRYREDPESFFRAFDYTEIQTTFFRFLLALRRSSSTHVEALHQYLHFLRKIGLKKEKDDKASDDENLFGIAFNAVPSILHALNLTSQIYTRDLYKSLKLDINKKPSLDLAEKMELFYFKEALFVILKAAILEVDFAHADYSEFDQRDLSASGEEYKGHRRQLYDKLQELRQFRAVKEGIVSGNPHALTKLESDDNSLDENQKKVLIRYHEYMTNKHVKEGVEAISLHMNSLELDEGTTPTTEETKKNITPLNS